MTNKFKIGLLGAGRTGGRVIDIYGKDNLTVYDETNLPTLDSLKQNAALISFLPGPALLEYIEMIIESGVPLASGSTGFEWPEDIDTRLKQKGIAWITASNFSLGMNLVHGMINVLGKAPELFDEYKFKLHEIHHIHKKDHPSGTALSWEKWLSQPVEFSHEREGDNPGDHKLTLSTQYEDITIQHQAKDRKIFAQGAIWTAEKLAKREVEPGLHQLSDIMQKELQL
jgi:4-hydroxy-tetrahydrodipicolinate reductase